MNKWHPFPTKREALRAALNSALRNEEELLDCLKGTDQQDIDRQKCHVNVIEKLIKDLK